jgi:dethiobiotin synthetase
MMHTFFVTGIGTGIGKTVASAILMQALQADYWKPIQSGYEEGTDADMIRWLVSNPGCTIYPSTYNLRLPASPHIAARKEGVRISLDEIHKDYLNIRSQSNRTLIIEGAGGLMVPLNEDQFVLDLIQSLQSEVILVSKNYLGSINHSLLTARQLQSSGIPVRGWIFMDDFMHYEEDICRWTGIPILGKIPFTKRLDTGFVSVAADLLSTQLLIKP